LQLNFNLKPKFTWSGAANPKVFQFRSIKDETHGAVRCQRKLVDHFLRFGREQTPLEGTNWFEPVRRAAMSRTEPGLYLPLKQTVLSTAAGFSSSNE
jgi:hypothetical protein